MNSPVKSHTKKKAMGQQESSGQPSAIEEAMMAQQYGLSKEELAEVRVWQDTAGKKSVNTPVTQQVKAQEAIGRRYANEWCSSEASMLQRCIAANRLGPQDIEAVLANPETATTKPCGKQIFNHMEYVL